jgi:hypothetical protein
MKTTLTALAYRLAFAFLFLAGLVRAQTSDLNLNGGSNYVDVARGVTWGTNFNRTYVLTPNSPNSSACVYVVNNNPSNSHTYTLQIFQTADPRVNDYSNNSGRYGATTVVGSYSPVAASSMAAAFTQSTAAAKIAFVFSASSTAGGSPDTADIFIVQTSASTCGASNGGVPVQGTIATGVSNLTQNPVTVGGTDLGNLARPFGVFRSASGDAGAALNGMAIGSVGIPTNLGTYPSLAFPNHGGPLATALFANIAGQNSVQAELTVSGVGAQNWCIQSSQLSCGGLFVTQTGFAQKYQFIASTASSPGNVPLWQGVGTIGMFETCRFDVVTSAISGSPSLTMWIQDGPDGINYTDRASFTITNPGYISYAAINSNASIAPTAPQQKLLASGSIVNGPIAGFGNVAWNVTGTTASITVVLTVQCH